MKLIQTKKTKLLLSVMLLCTSVIQSMQQFHPIETTTLVSSDGLKFFVVNSESLFKLSPVIKELTSFTYQNNQKILEFSEINALTLQFLLTAIKRIAPLEKILCQGKKNELHFYPFKKVKDELDPLFLAQKISKKRKLLEEEMFLADLFNASTFLEIEPLSNYFAYKIAEAIQSQDEKTSNEFLQKLGLGQSLQAHDLVMYHLVLVRNGLEDYTLADYVLDDVNLKVNKNILNINFMKELTSLRGLQCVNGIDSASAIQISYSSVFQIPPNVFSGLDNVREIDLSMNKIITLPAEAFKGLPNMYKITLNNNNITNLPAELFQYVPNIQEIGLGANAITVITPELLSGLSRLTDLDLGRNKINYLPENTFKSLTNLLRLDLMANQLENLPENIFSNVHNLQCLLLSYNQINSLPLLFQGLYKLKYVSLNGNNLTELPQNLFKDLKNAEIDLTGNNFNEQTLEHLQQIAILRGLKIKLTGDY